MRRYGGGMLYAALPLHMQRGCFRIRTHDQQVTKTQLYRCTKSPRHNFTHDYSVGIKRQNVQILHQQVAGFKCKQSACDLRRCYNIIELKWKMHSSGT
ncbi:hypothetical protein GmHk_04G011651 [Glycine max]|nr:hypothetical protein GmHk_04G011651 [Glycine max]